MPFHCIGKESTVGFLHFLQNLVGIVKSETLTQKQFKAFETDHLILVMADEIIDPMIEDLLADLLEEVKRQPPFKRLPSEPRRKKIGRMLKSLRVRLRHSSQVLISGLLQNSTAEDEKK